MKVVDWGYLTDEHRNAITLSTIERWEKGQFKRTIKELSQFDNKKLDNSYSSSHFKGRNIVDLDFVYKQLLDKYKACRTTLSLT